MNVIKKILLLSSILSLTACVISPLEEKDEDRSLSWCPPLHNCASTEAVTFVHSIQPFELRMPLDKAWPLIREAVNELPGTSIEYEYQGYIYAKSYSAAFHFLDYFEVLAVPEENLLAVRSSSFIAITDFFVNYHRTEAFREKLEEKEVLITQE